MTIRIHFVLVAEGSSDEGLLSHLEKLCIAAGADEVTGTAPDFQRLRASVGSSVEEKLHATLLLEPEAQLLFIHRDADGPDATARYDEIAQAIKGADITGKWHVSIVPVQETEAWLLLDEHAIRHVAGNPRGTRPLNLPWSPRVESIANPKERLRSALITASELSGRRLQRFKLEFATHRRLLLQRLPIGGQIEQVPSWTRLRSDTEAVIENMRR